MEAFLVSTGIVALAEVGDKTAAGIGPRGRFREPMPIILGILAATLANHALAGAAGGWLAAIAGPNAIRRVLGVSFVAMALWNIGPGPI